MLLQRWCISQISDLVERDERDPTTLWMPAQEVEDLERQLRLMCDSAAALATANGIRQLTLSDKGRTNKISAQSIARKVCNACSFRPVVHHSLAV